MSFFLDYDYFNNKNHGSDLSGLKDQVIYWGQYTYLLNDRSFHKVEYSLGEKGENNLVYSILHLSDFRGAQSTIIIGTDDMLSSLKREIFVDLFLSQYLSGGDIVTNYIVESASDLLLNAHSYKADDFLYWYSFDELTQPIHVGTKCTIEDIVTDSILYLTNQDQVTDSINAGKDSIDVTQDIGLLFNVDAPFFLVSIDLYSVNTTNTHRVIIENIPDNNNIVINHYLPQGGYKIYLESPSKIYVDSESIVDFQYSIGEELVSIENDLRDSRTYHLFYNWEVLAYLEYCESEPIENSIALDKFENKDGTLLLDIKDLPRGLYYLLALGKEKPTSYKFINA